MTTETTTTSEFYQDHQGNTFPEETWTTEDGRKIQVRDLSPEHAKNIIRMILRNQRIQMEEYIEAFNAMQALLAQAELEESKIALH